MKPYLFSQLLYTPTDYTALQQQINACTQQIVNATSPNMLLQATERFGQLMDDAAFSRTLATIRSSLNCADPVYSAATDLENTGAAKMDTSEYYQSLLASPFFPQLEEYFGPEYRLRLEKERRTHAAGHEEMVQEQMLIAQYQQKRALLEITYQGKRLSVGEMLAHYDDTNRQVRIDARKAVAQAVLDQKETFSSILLSLITLRDQIAKANGFANYLEYANAVYDRRGYGEKELADFCQQVRTELVPLLHQLDEEQRQKLGLDKRMEYDTLHFSDGNAKPLGNHLYLIEQAKKMYTALSPAMGDFFCHMVQSESLDIGPSPAKVSGMGFCTNLGKGYDPFVFGNCNGTSDDVDIFTHEMGHAYQEYLTGLTIRQPLLRDMALDAVEIPSKAMELFAYPYAELFFGQDAKKYRYSHFRNTLRDIAAYCAIHEFESWIYTHVGASFEELVEQEMYIQRLYHPDLCFGELTPFISQGSRLLLNMAVYTIPRYVISYALSEMGALQLMDSMAKDPAGTWTAYERLCASGGSRNYSDTLAQAGLTAAYAPGTVRRIVDFAKKQLHNN